MRKNAYRKAEDIPPIRIKAWEKKVEKALSDHPDIRAVFELLVRRSSLENARAVLLKEYAIWSLIELSGETANIEDFEPGPGMDEFSKSLPGDEWTLIMNNAIDVSEIIAGGHTKSG